MFKQRKSYIVIPILGILAITVCTVFSFYNKWKTNFSLLEEYDFTGKTKIFLFFISIMDICILLVDLYLVIRTNENGFPYIFNKIFTVTFVILTLISLFAFVIVRNEEEKVALQYTEEISQKAENIKDIKRLNLYSDIADKKYDQFSEKKEKIVEEIYNSNNKLERYLGLILPIYYSDGYAIQKREKNYYTILIRFALINFILASNFAYHIKDEYIEKNTNI